MNKSRSQNRSVKIARVLLTNAIKVTLQQPHLRWSAVSIAVQRTAKVLQLHLH